MHPGPRGPAVIRLLPNSAWGLGEPRAFHDDRRAIEGRGCVLTDWLEDPLPRWRSPIPRDVHRHQPLRRGQGPSWSLCLLSSLLPVERRLWLPFSVKGMFNSSRSAGCQPLVAGQGFHQVEGGRRWGRSGRIGGRLGSRAIDKRRALWQVREGGLSSFSRLSQAFSPPRSGGSSDEETPHSQAVAQGSRERGHAP
jgi:hypothetical protein